MRADVANRLGYTPGTVGGAEPPLPRTVRSCRLTSRNATRKARAS
jgi:hypothetical protein